jgi:hypothetical protein
MAKKGAAWPAPKIEPRQPTAINIRGFADWRSGPGDFTGRIRTCPTSVIDLAPAKLGEHEDFREPPPRI